MDESAWRQAARPMRRRGFLRIAGLGLGAASAAPLLAACGGGDDDKGKTTSQATSAPATGGSQVAASAATQAAKLSGNMTVLMWSHFVPAYDKWFDKFAEDWGTANGVKVRVDHIPHLELPARHAAEIAAQGGHDLMEFTGSGGGAHLYSRHLEDLDDIALRLDKEKGGWVNAAKTLSVNGGKWKTLPSFFIRFPVLYREDLWAEHAGLPKGPDSWDDLLEGGRKLKAKGNWGGFGMANHVDSNVTCTALLWSYGSKVVQEDGKTLAINSKETRDALRFGKALFDEAMEKDVLAWDDASNNQLLASGKGSWITNPISASLSIKGQNLELYNKIGIANTPKGPAGRKTPVPTNAFGIWKFAKNKEAARAFLNHFTNNWMEGYKVSVSYNEPMLKSWVDDGFKWVPTIEDPRLKLLTDFSPFAELYAWPGPMTPAAEEVWQLFLVPQMFAKVARGTSIDDTLKETEAAMKKIYDKHNT